MLFGKSVGYWSITLIFLFQCVWLISYKNKSSLPAISQATFWDTSLFSDMLPVLLDSPQWNGTSAPCDVFTLQEEVLTRRPVFVYVNLFYFYSFANARSHARLRIGRVQFAGEYHKYWRIFFLFGDGGVVVAVVRVGVETQGQFHCQRDWWFS